MVFRCALLCCLLIIPSIAFGQSTYWSLTNSDARLLERFNGDSNDDSTGDPNGTEGNYNLAWDGTPAYIAGPTGKGPGLAFDVGGGNNLASTATLNEFNGANKLTMSCWVYVTSMVTGDGPLCLMAGVSTQRANIGLLDTLRWQFSVVNGGTVRHRSTANNTLTLGQWHFVAYQYDGGQFSSLNRLQVVVDSHTRVSSTEAGSGQAPTSLAAADPTLYVGRFGSTTPSANSLEGRLFDVRIWTDTLSEGVDGDLDQLMSGPEPTNTVSPSAPSGTAAPGQTLTADTGTWEDHDNGTLSYTYQWQADTLEDNNFVDISGATSSTYVVDPSYENDQIRVVIAASNSGGGNDPAMNVASAPVLIQSGFNISPIILYYMNRRNNR